MMFVLLHIVIAAIVGFVPMALLMWGIIDNYCFECEYDKSHETIN